MVFRSSVLRCQDKSQECGNGKKELRFQATCPFLGGGKQVLSPSYISKFVHLFSVVSNVFFCLIFTWGR